MDDVGRPSARRPGRSPPPPPARPREGTVGFGASRGVGGASVSGAPSASADAHGRGARRAGAMCVAMPSSRHETADGCARVRGW
eukprot:SAG11_NODE_340_length_10476_cov_6.009155_12_plen_84_part_00